jgi:hypothetical protein
MRAQWIVLGSATPPPQNQDTKRPTNYPLINVYKRLVINNHGGIFYFLLYQKFPNFFSGGNSCFPLFGGQLKLSEEADAIQQIEN